MTEEYQLSNFGFIFDKATDQQKNMYIRSLVDGNIVKKDAVISKTPMFSLRVISTYPEDCIVLITSASRVTLTDSKCDTSNQVLELEKSLETMSIAGEDIGNIGKENHISSLQKAYEALFEVVCFPFLYKDWIEKLNIECPKGVLLYGPPGVGKTFLVSSIAKRCNAKLFIIQGPEIFGPFIGESEEKLRAKFTEAREYAIRENVPVILFIDEIDALTPRRDNSQSHENRMVAQLLTLMDGVKSRGRLIIVGATNRPNSIDPALRRPGRFDREISMDPPNAEDRYALFEAQLNKMPLDDAVDIETLSTMTNGYVAADINAMCREAAMNAIQRASKHHDSEVVVNISDFKSAFATVGPSMQRGFQVQVEKMNWDDVGGLEDVKKRLKQAVEWPLLYKDSFKKLGLKPPRGILLYGPPGCSKTTLVKVIASSANVAFLSINGAQLYSPFVGDSEKIVRTTFQKARASAPSIIFLDETEAIVGKRNMGNGGSSGDSVQERVLSTLLNEMDGVESAESVLVVGATNRPDMLDAALMRPGRFDQVVYVPPPDEYSRFEILKIHTKHMPLASDVDLMDIAARTNYYTGADLQNICRESAMEALRSNKLASDVTMVNFNFSLSTIPPSLNAESVKEYSKKPFSSD
ncbi:P-loop containing nucleoside triphosphate hydrolase protein [Pilaira anomala]|nr:P-loop containing nucleoside triphosphate hydrolase protein [Pilaira anomala]